MNKLLIALLAMVATLHTGGAYAQIRITEVDAAGSAASYAADWFELTNFGTSAVDISGWKMDDNSNSFAQAVALRGVTSIGAGQSIVFIEGNTSGSNDATIQANFKSAWFGSNVPAGFTIAGYGGSGVGLSQAVDAVNIFMADGTLVTRVDFGVSSLGQTIDNSAGLTNVTLNQFSVGGINGAFTSFNAAEIGSPAAIPEPETYALMLAGLGFIGGVARKRLV